MSLHLHHNRPQRRRKYRVPRQFAGRVEDPFAGAFRFGNKPLWRWGSAAALAALIQGGLLSLAIYSDRHPPPPVHREIPVMVAERRPPPPPALPPPPEPPPPPAEKKASRPRMARSAPPPPPAQAAKVIASAADPNAPVDLGGFSMVTGEATSYAGGVSSHEGTSKKAVAAPPPPRAPPHPAAPPAPSQARPTSPSRDDWSCAWPDEEQDSEWNDARVAIRVTVDRDGSPLSVSVLSTPKPSFGQAAQRCAMGETYRPALNDAGERVGATTAPFLVHFLR